MDSFGTIVDMSTVRFERTFPWPIGRMWMFLINADRRAHWFTGGSIAAYTSGPVRLKNGVDGRVTSYIPPWMLEFRSLDRLFA